MQDRHVEGDTKGRRSAVGGCALMLVAIKKTRVEDYPWSDRQPYCHTNMTSFPC